MQLLCPVVVGREAELAGMEAALGASARRHGGLVLLSGEAGTGKTRLCREMRALAERRGIPVLAGRAVQEAPSPYRPLAEALASALRPATQSLEAPGMAPFRAVLGRLVPQWRSDGALEADASAVAVGESLLRVLLCLDAPSCLVILEDLHWADPDTLAVVEYLADNIASEPVMVIATLRSEEGGGAQILAQRLQARRSLTTVSLSRLGIDEEAAMIQACIGGGEVPNELAGLVSSRAEGVPFVVEEVLATLAASGALQKAGDRWVLAGSAGNFVPSSFAAATHRRVASLGPDAASVVRAAAVLGAAFDWRLLARATGLAEHAVLDGLRRAVGAQLVLAEASGSDASAPGFRFRHALTAEALRAEMLPPERAELARTALDALLAAEPDLAGPACEMAASLAETAGEPERAARFLIEAAERSARMGALATAAERISRATALAVEMPTRASATCRLLEVLTLAGRSEEALQAGNELLALLEGGDLPDRGARLVAAHLCLARSATRAGRADVADAHLRSCGELLAGPGATPDKVARLEIERGEAALLRADMQNTVAAARSALAATGSPELRCEAWMLLGRALRTGDLGAAAEAFSQARSAAAGPKLAVWRMLATHELGTIDLFTTNRRDRLQEARRLAEGGGAFGALAAIELHLAVAADLAGSPVEAVQRAGNCTEIARRLGLGPLVAIGLGVHADVLAAGGQRVDVERLADEILSMDGSTPDARAAAWGALARSSLCAEDHQRALSELEASVACVRGQGLTTGPGPYYGYRAVLSSLRGDHGEDAITEARALGAEVSGWNRGLLACAEAVLAGRRGDQARAEELAASAERQLAPFSGYGYLALRLMGQAAVESGWGAPGRWLRRALGFAEERGLAEMASACSGLLRRAGEPPGRSRRVFGELPPGLQHSGISPRELEVLGLVAKGLANAEIAERLYLSVRTVEKHVESLLRKTGLNRRTQLAALSARADEVRGSRKGAMP